MRTRATWSFRNCSAARNWPFCVRRSSLLAKDAASAPQREEKSVLENPPNGLKAPAPAGGMELHHCNMLHSSTANRGTKPRSAIVIQYRAADNAQIGGSSGHFG